MANTGRTMDNTIGYTTQSQQTYSHPFTSKTGRLLASYHMEAFSTASPHRHPPTTAGLRPNTPTSTRPCAWECWQANQRQFPPWQYKPQYLTWYQDREWTTISPTQRERLMGLSDGFTQNEQNTNTDRQRNTMIGNAWHLYPQSFGSYSYCCYPPQKPSHSRLQYQQSNK